MYALAWPSWSGILEALYKLSDSYSKPTLIEDGIHQPWVFNCALMIIATSHAPLAKFVRIDKDDCVLLVVDLQIGLFQVVRDYQPDEYKNNIFAHAALGKVFNLPTILTTSAENGTPSLKCISF